MAVHEGKIAVVKLLTDAHADVNAETEVTFTLYSFVWFKKLFYCGVMKKEAP